MATGFLLVIIQKFFKYFSEVFLLFKEREKKISGTFCLQSYKKASIEEIHPKIQFSAESSDSTQFQFCYQKNNLQFS
jgi:hypothetical protein